MPKPYPEEFRLDVVATVRRTEASHEQIAKDFGISLNSIANWLRRADVDVDVDEGITLTSRSRSGRDISGSRAYTGAPADSAAAMQAGGAV